MYLLSPISLLQEEQILKQVAYFTVEGNYPNRRGKRCRARMQQLRHEFGSSCRNVERIICKATWDWKLCIIWCIHSRCSKLRKYGPHWAKPAQQRDAIGDYSSRTCTCSYFQPCVQWSQIAWKAVRLSVRNGDLHIQPSVTQRHRKRAEPQRNASFKSTSKRWRRATGEKIRKELDGNLGTRIRLTYWLTKQLRRTLLRSRLWGTMRCQWVPWDGYHKECSKTFSFFVCHNGCKCIGSSKV